MSYVLLPFVSTLSTLHFIPRQIHPQAGMGDDVVQKRAFWESAYQLEFAWLISSFRCTVLSHQVWFCICITAAEELLEIIMRRYERASTIITSNRPVDDWGKLLGDSAAVTAMLDRLLHHGHVLKCGPRSWRTKSGLPPQQAAG